MMKQHILSCFLLFSCTFFGLLASCSDELVEVIPASVEVNDKDLAGIRLALDVAALNTSFAQTRADDDSDDRLSGTDAERKIDNIWVFQFDATSHKLLITPRYYDLSDKNFVPDAETGREVEVLLKPGVSSIVYVVANAGRINSVGSDWATVSNSATLDDVKKLTLISPKHVAVNVGESPVDLCLPMEGASQTVTPTQDEMIKVTVTRMYAKVEILVGDIPESLVLTDVNVSQMPYYCRVGTLAPENQEEAASYPIEHKDWNSYAFKPGTKDEEGRYTGKLVVYLPENLQGCTDVAENDSNMKTEKAPANALSVDFVVNYVDIFTGEEKETGRHYIVYPGANNYNDYNIKRNCIYRVKLNIYTDQYNQDIPSSNCFVVKPNQSLSFLPYYRTETGGGYDFTDYLDADGTDESKKIRDSKTMTENVKIIWQTQDAIGDNSKGDLVWIDHRSDAKDEFHRKIHVKTGKRGNALIAAYNNSGKIVWSWHIWVTENEPGNVSNAVVYSTYAWNEEKIFTSIRVPGYAIMPCNLGALKYEPDDVDKIDPDTHGMLYQWGRKDPFPPGIYWTTDNGDQRYTDKYTGPHYDNDNTTKVLKTSGTVKNKLFHSISGKDIVSETGGQTIGYTIQNPTVFLCGTQEADADRQRRTPETDETYYNNLGDWLPGHDNKLWGGLDPSDDSNMKAYTLKTANGIAHIYDNYGDQKSIFDPCPSGWRVPPGDLWLGFTSTGKNPSGYDDINTPSSIYTGNNSPGMYLYMNAWKQGTTSFFPTQGTRLPSGRISAVGSCGNYHNATTDDNNRVNIMHVHRQSLYFHVFELEFPMYYVKSVGGPIRCVRDHK